MSPQDLKLEQATPEKQTSTEQTKPEQKKIPFQEFSELFLLKKERDKVPDYFIYNPRKYKDKNTLMPSE